MRGEWYVCNIDRIVWFDVWMYCGVIPGIVVCFLD